jgi:hypothetical protein
MATWSVVPKSFDQQVVNVSFGHLVKTFKKPFEAF